jgi:hypothetical protein
VSTSDTTATAATQCGRTPAELGRLLRVSADRIRSMIVRGELGAINTAPRRGGKPRYVILPHHLQEWEMMHRAAVPQATPRRKRRTQRTDFYPS